MIRTGLQEPGSAGTYDPETSLAGFDFGPEVWPEFFAPDLSNWRLLLALYHEWVHHYQYHATTFGYLYRIVANTQLLLANGILRIAAEERGSRPVRLPLASRSEPIAASAGHPNDISQRLVTLLQAQRVGILGHGPHVEYADFDEYRLASVAFRENFGGPMTIVMEPTYMPAPPRIRYPATYLLETHAHILSTLWLMLAVDRNGGHRRLTEAALAQANEHLVGPYAAFSQFVPGLPGGADQIKLFCALAEIALNPPGVHRHPRQSPEELYNVLYTSWFPVVRMESLMWHALEGRIPWPGEDRAETGRRLLESVGEAFEQGGSPRGTFLAGADGAVAVPTLEAIVDRTMRYAAVEDDVPPPLLAFQIDGLAKLIVAEGMKERSPLLLSGFVIEELRDLVARLGGPSAICRDGTRSYTLVGACSGLLHLGLLSPETLRVGGEAVVHNGLPIAYALQLLLVRNRTELESQLDQPLFGTGGWTLRSVLAEHYGLRLHDFE
jgi:hypothetical protein